MPDLGSIFLDRYLEEATDYTGLPLLNLYRVYRSLVRAKVAYLELQSGSEKAACLARYAESASCGPHRPYPWGLRRR